jgi:hypothetical protein
MTAVEPTTDVAVQELLQAWTRWDRHPADRQRCIDFELACAPVAERAGVTVTTLRSRLMTARRTGLSRAVCVERALA